MSVDEEIRDLLERRLVAWATVINTIRDDVNEKVRAVHDMMLSQLVRDTARVLGETDVNAWLKSINVQLPDD